MKGKIFKILTKRKPFPGFMNLYHQTNKKKEILWYNFRHTKEFSPYPITAKVEINGSCNLNCIMCRRTQLTDRNKQMTYESFVEILDKLDHLVEVSFHGYNEPLTHPLFQVFAKEVYCRNIKFCLVTNGLLLTPKQLNMLKEYPPRLIRISLDGVKDRYEEIRQGAKWDILYENLLYLSRMKYCFNIQLYATIWKGNLDQVEPLYKFAKYLDLPIVFRDITYQNNYKESILANSVRENYLTAMKVFKLQEQYKDLNFMIENDKRTCSLPWNSVYIDVTGEMYPCTDNLEYSLGNIFQMKKFDYNSNRMKAFRSMSLTGSIDTCRNCLGWNEKIK